MGHAYVLTNWLDFGLDLQEGDRCAAVSARWRGGGAGTAGTGHRAQGTTAARAYGGTHGTFARRPGDLPGCEAWRAFGRFRPAQGWLRVGVLRLDIINGILQRAQR